MEKRYLVADIGGTTTRLALFAIDSKVCELTESKNFQSQEYLSFEEILQQYLEDKHYNISGASIGIAGPIMEGRSIVTNLNWVIEEGSVSEALGGIPVNLLNDLQAVSYAIPHLQPSDLETLIPGEPTPRGGLGVVAPGTGLGEGFLLWTGNAYVPFPSEGGHASFGPETPLQLELLNYLDPLFGHVSYERVCSGIGITNLYAFLRDAKGYDEPVWLKNQITAVADPVPIIVEAALNKKAEICVETMSLFVSILGSESGNLALKILATGGIYLAGGIPRRILPLLRGDNFQVAFTDKGRFAKMLCEVPVYVLTHPQAGLFGAACHGQQILGK